MRSDFSVVQALKAAVTFVPRAWAGAWLILVLLLVVMLGLPFVVQATLLAGLLAVFVLFILKLVAQGALYRISLFGRDAKAEGLGFGGLQFGWPELRLLGAAVIVSLFVFMIAMTIGIVFAITFSMSDLSAGYASSLAAVCALLKRHSGADYVFIVYIAAALVLLVFLGMKLVLVPVANMGRRKLIALNGLGLTTGYVGRLFIGLVVITAPFLFGAAGVLHLLPMTGASAFPVHAGLLILDIFILFPLIVGFLTSAYRQIMAIRSK